MAEDTIEALRPRKGKLPEWGRELLAVGDALREAGVAEVDLHEAAAELGMSSDLLARGTGDGG